MKKTLALCALALLGAAACRGTPGSSGGWQGEDPSTVFGGSPGSPAQPEYGSVVSPASAPPPVSGGTLTIGRDGHTAVAADPDRDRVYVADVLQRRRTADIALTAGDEPGRVVEGRDGIFHVALRRGGAVLTVDAAAGTIVGRVAVCPAPRGLAYEPNQQLLYVACTDGSLVTLRTTDGAVVRTLHLDADLRDVIIDGDRLLVSRFRAAELLVVASDGTVTHRWAPAPNLGDAGSPPERTDASTDASADPDVIEQGIAPAVAWRVIPAPWGGVLMVHQTAQRGLVVDDPHDPNDPSTSGSERSPRGQPSAAYGSGGCGAIVASAVTHLSDSHTFTSNNSLLGAVLPVDIAAARHTDRIVLVAAGNSRIRAAPLLYSLQAGAFSGFQSGGCGLDNSIMTQPVAQPVAVAFDGRDQLVVQTREPASLFLIDEHATITLSDVSREDTGHTIFHSNTGANLACASCHPEGGDDGRVWRFSVEGRRRTQNLRGGLAGTEPFHWGGELATMSNIVGEVLNRRMGGPQLAPAQLDALSHWVNTIPRVPLAAPADAAAVERGRALFNDATVACASCHAGAQGTNNATVAAGTGAAFQVPRLVGLALRAPYMHDGCAATLRDRFGACGGGDNHGHTSQLTPAQIDDLVAYLQTL